MIVSGMRLTTQEGFVTLDSGASGQGLSVAAPPPHRGSASSTTARALARARYAPATRPSWPPPITIASYRFTTGFGGGGYPREASRSTRRGGRPPERDPEPVQVANDELAHAVERVVRALHHVDPALQTLAQASTSSVWT